METAVAQRRIAAAQLVYQNYYQLKTDEMLRNGGYLVVDPAADAVVEDEA